MRNTPHKNPLFYSSLHELKKTTIIWVVFRCAHGFFTSLDALSGAPCYRTKRSENRERKRYPIIHRHAIRSYSNNAHNYWLTKDLHQDMIPSEMGSIHSQLPTLCVDDTLKECAVCKYDTSPFPFKRGNLTKQLKFYRNFTLKLTYTAAALTCRRHM